MGTFKRRKVDGYGILKHKELVLFHLKKGGYNGVMGAMVQGMSFQEAQRTEDVMSRVLSDMGR